jgi:hypothetical protein
VRPDERRVKKTLRRKRDGYTPPTPSAETISRLVHMSRNPKLAASDTAKSE